MFHAVPFHPKVDELVELFHVHERNVVDVSVNLARQVSVGRHAFVAKAIGVRRMVEAVRLHFVFHFGGRQTVVALRVLFVNAFALFFVFVQKLVERFVFRRLNELFVDTVRTFAVAAVLAVVLQRLLQVHSWHAVQTLLAFRMRALAGESTFGQQNVGRGSLFFDFAVNRFAARASQRSAVRLFEDAVAVVLFVVDAVYASFAFAVVALRLRCRVCCVCAQIHFCVLVCKEQRVAGSKTINNDLL